MLFGPDKVRIYYYNFVTNLLIKLGATPFLFYFIFLLLERQPILNICLLIQV